MSTHLTHKLPWEALTEIAAKLATLRAAGVPYSSRITQKQVKAIRHFARCFQSTLMEFIETDRTETPELDPRTWGVEEVGGLGHLGYHYSLLWGYVTLNLILAEPKHVKALSHMNRSVLEVLCGRHDGVIQITLLSICLGRLKTTEIRSSR